MPPSHIQTTHSPFSLDRAGKAQAAQGAGEGLGEERNLSQSPGAFQNIQSSGLTAQRKKMSHICWPLATVNAFRAPDSRARQILLHSQEQLGLEDAFPALSPGP